MTVLNRKFSQRLEGLTRYWLKIEFFDEPVAPNRRIFCKEVQILKIHPLTHISQAYRDTVSSGDEICVTKEDGIRH